MSKIIKDDYNNEINVHDEIYDNHSIKMPIYYYDEDDDNGIRHYDFEEMANELEYRICKTLNRNVLITISELEDDMDKDDMDINDLTFTPTEEE